MSDQTHADASAEADIERLRDRIIAAMEVERAAGMCATCCARALFSALTLPIAAMPDDRAPFFVAAAANELIQCLPDIRSQIAAASDQHRRGLN